MKKITSLIKDIYNLFKEDKGCKLSDSKRDKIIDTCVENIRKQLTTSIMGKDKDEARLRMSNVGYPDRQLWYQFQNVEGERLRDNDPIKFLYGHIIEELVFCFAELAGHKVTDRQKETNLGGIKGHIDGRVNGVLVDVKSASPHGYDKFVKETIFSDDPFGYIAQISGYADGEDEAAFIVMNKVTGQIHVATIDNMEMIDFKDKVKKVKKALKKNTPPERCYSDLPDGKSGNRKLSMGCAYCGFKIECWKDANGGKGLRKFKYSNGSRFLTHVAKRPHKDIEEEDV